MHRLRLAKPLPQAGSAAPRECVLKTRAKVAERVKLNCNALRNTPPQAFPQAAESLGPASVLKGRMSAPLRCAAPLPVHDIVWLLNVTNVITWGMQFTCVATAKMGCSPSAMENDSAGVVALVVEGWNYTNQRLMLWSTQDDTDRSRSGTGPSYRSPSCHGSRHGLRSV